MSNFSLMSISNATTSASVLSLNELLDKLGYEQWQTIINTFILPPINFLGTIFCSFSLWIFFRSSFADPIFFYYKLLCLINILSLIHNIPYGILLSPFYFPWVDMYAVGVFKIYYSFMSSLLFHFEDVLQMGILLHKMKQFSPFVKRHYRASPQFISLAFFLTCLLINSPFIFNSAITSLGDYFYIDSNGVKQTGTFYSFKPSKFGQTFFGRILIGFTAFFLNLFLSFLVGVILNISSYIKYKSYVNTRKREVEQLQMSSLNNRPTTNREMIQMSQREKTERKIERNMFYMALTLCFISFFTRFVFIALYLYFLSSGSFSNPFLILLISNFIYTIGPTISIVIFYSFNQMFRDETNKKVLGIQPRQSPKIIFISHDVRF
jgi:hypothetical protein